jgi:hypothetical protein
MSHRNARLYISVQAELAIATQPHTITVSTPYRRMHTKLLTGTAPTRRLQVNGDAKPSTSTSFWLLLAASPCSCQQGHGVNFFVPLCFGASPLMVSATEQKNAGATPSLAPLRFALRSPRQLTRPRVRRVSGWRLQPVVLRCVPRAVKLRNLVWPPGHCGNRLLVSRSGKHQEREFARPH